jgi:hypothetical protein
MRLRRLARTAGLIALVAAAALAAPGGAAAGPPEPFHFELTADDICSFPVEVVYDGRANELQLPGDRLLVTAPGQHLVATNLDNGRSVRLTINGTFTITDLPDGGVSVVGHGPSGFFDPALGFVVLRGSFSFTIDADGTSTSPSGVGTAVDVCAAIA